MLNWAICSSENKFSIIKIKLAMARLHLSLNNNWLGPNSNSKTNNSNINGKIQHNSSIACTFNMPFTYITRLFLTGIIYCANYEHNVTFVCKIWLQFSLKKQLPTQYKVLFKQKFLNKIENIKVVHVIMK